MKYGGLIKFLWNKSDDFHFRLFCRLCCQWRKWVWMSVCVCEKVAYILVAFAGFTVDLRVIHSNKRRAIKVPKRIFVIYITHSDLPAELLTWGKDLDSQTFRVSDGKQLMNFLMANHLQKEFRCKIAGERQKLAILSELKQPLSNSIFTTTQSQLCCHSFVFGNLCFIFCDFLYYRWYRW